MILPRYIIKEHIGPFFFSLAVIMFVFVTKFVVQYIGKIFGKGLAWSTIIEFIYLNLAWMLALAVPMAVLVASLMAFGRFSADNEITILKTSGISIYQVIRPVIFLASILTLIMIWYNDRVLPEFNHRARTLYQSISRKKPTLELEEGLYLNLGNFSILVEDIDKSFEARVWDKSNILSPALEGRDIDKLKHITIFDHSSEVLHRTVIADHGYLIFDKEREQLVFNLFEGEIHEINIRDYSEYRRLNFVRNVFYIPAPDMVFKRQEATWRGDREMNIRMMKNKIKRYRDLIQKEKRQIQQDLMLYFRISDKVQNINPPDASQNARIELTHLRPAQTRAVRKTQAVLQKIKSAQTNINYYKKQIYKYEVEIHKKFSIPFACIVFVLIGAPLGIKTRKGSLGVGITFSIGFFLLYWVCLIGGEELADRHLLFPVLAMWSPNILVGFFGILLTYRTVKETTFIKWEKLPRFLQLFFKGEEQPAP